MSGYVSRKLRADRGNGERSTSGKRGAGKSGTATLARPNRPKKKTSTKPRGASEARRRPSPRPSPGASRSRRVADPRRTLLRVAVAAVIATLLAAGLYVGARTWGPGDHGEAAAKAASTAAAALFSYDHRDFDASIDNGARYAHGVFAESWTAAAEGLRETAVAQEAQVVAKVVDVAVLNPSTTFTDKDGTVYAGAVEVLAFMDQTTKNAKLEGSVKRDQSRVVLTMVEIDGRWLVVGVIAL